MAEERQQRGRDRDRNREEKIDDGMIEKLVAGGETMYPLQLGELFDEANALAEAHRASIERFYDCSHEMKVCLADMYVAATLARSNAYYGAWALNTDAPELPVAASASAIWVLGLVAEAMSSAVIGSYLWSWQRAQLSVSPSSAVPVRAHAERAAARSGRVSFMVMSQP